MNNETILKSYWIQRFGSFSYRGFFFPSNSSARKSFHLQVHFSVELFYWSDVVMLRLKEVLFKMPVKWEWRKSIFLNSYHLKPLIDSCFLLIKEQ